MTLKWNKMGTVKDDGLPRKWYIVLVNTFHWNQLKPKRHNIELATEGQSGYFGSTIFHF